MDLRKNGFFRHHNNLFLSLGFIVLITFLSGCAERYEVTIHSEPGHGIEKKNNSEIPAEGATGMQSPDLIPLFENTTTIDNVKPATVTISTNASTGGNIYNVTMVPTLPGTDAVYDIIPDPGFRISGVIVDGIEKGEINTFRFQNVTSYHSITAYFKPDMSSKKYWAKTIISVIHGPNGLPELDTNLISQGVGPCTYIGDYGEAIVGFDPDLNLSNASDITVYEKTDSDVGYSFNPRINASFTFGPTFADEYYTVTVLSPHILKIKLNVGGFGSNVPFNINGISATFPSSGNSS